MRQEIYARHGKVFKEPWLQKYFASFDWYKPDPDFNDSMLTEVEKQNIATLVAYRKRRRAIRRRRGLIRPTPVSRDETKQQSRSSRQ